MHVPWTFQDNDHRSELITLLTCAHSSGMTAITNYTSNIALKSDSNLTKKNFKLILLSVYHNK